MTLTAPLFPRGPVDVGSRLHTLPADGSVPHMPGWQWLHTPGHAVGHVSLWREADRALLSADAVITVAQESAYAVMTDEAEMHGPPAYFAQDWPSAKASVAKLAGLEPELLVPGHGRAVAGPAMRDALHTLAATFDQVALPEHARYAEHPARAEDGTAYVSKTVKDASIRDNNSTSVIAFCSAKQKSLLTSCIAMMLSAALKANCIAVSISII